MVNRYSGNRSACQGTKWVHAKTSNFCVLGQFLLAASQVARLAAAADSTDVVTERSAEATPLEWVTLANYDCTCGCPGLPANNTPAYGCTQAIPQPSVLACQASAMENNHSAYAYQASAKPYKNGTRQCWFQWGSQFSWRDTKSCPPSANRTAYCRGIFKNVGHSGDTSGCQKGKVKNCKNDDAPSASRTVYINSKNGSDAADGLSLGSRGPQSYDPQPAPGTVINGTGARITVVRRGLFRVQLGEPEDFDERPTFQVVNRRSGDGVDYTVLSSQLPAGGIGAATHENTANVTVVPDASGANHLRVRFGCAGRAGWEWVAQPGGPAPATAEAFGMPISRRGAYVIDDTHTARLGGGDAGKIDWWQHPRSAPAPPPPPPPAPAPKDKCADPQAGTDCAPNKAIVISSLTNQNQSSCCSACNKDSRCQAWVWGSAGGGLNCWLQSSCKATVNGSTNRVFGGAVFAPPPPAPPAPVDLYFMCYADDHQQGLEQLTTITGTAPLMPMAAYGVWYSGCCIPELYNSTAVRELLLAEYKKQDLPLDTFVFDFFWHRRNGWGGYSWDRTHFPDGEALMASFRDGSNPYGMAVKTLNNHHPVRASTRCTAAQPVARHCRCFVCAVTLLFSDHIALGNIAEWVHHHTCRRGPLRCICDGDGRRPQPESELPLQLLRQGVRDGAPEHAARRGRGLSLGRLCHLLRPR
jgi:hypothetical protein